MKKINTILALVALTIAGVSNISATQTWKRARTAPVSAPKNINTGINALLSAPNPSQNLISTLNVTANTKSLNDLNTKSLGSNKAYVSNATDVNLQGAPSTTAAGVNSAAPEGANTGALTFGSHTVNSVAGGAMGIGITDATKGTIAELTSTAPTALKTGALTGASESFISNSSSAVNNQSGPLTPMAFASATSGAPMKFDAVPFSGASGDADVKVPQNINLISTQDVTSNSKAKNTVATVGSAKAGAITNNALKLTSMGNTGGAIGSTNYTAQAVGSVEAGTVIGASKITAQNMQQNTNSANSTAITAATAPAEIAVVQQTGG